MSLIDLKDIPNVTINFIVIGDYEPVFLNYFK